MNNDSNINVRGDTRGDTRGVSQESAPDGRINQNQNQNQNKTDSIRLTPDQQKHIFSAVGDHQLVVDEKEYKDMTEILNYWLIFLKQMIDISIRHIYETDAMKRDEYKSKYLEMIKIYSKIGSDTQSFQKRKDFIVGVLGNYANIAKMIQRDGEESNVDASKITLNLGKLQKLYTVNKLPSLSSYDLGVSNANATQSYNHGPVDSQQPVFQQSQSQQVQQQMHVQPHVQSHVQPQLHLNNNPVINFHHSQQQRHVAPPPTIGLLSHPHPHTQHKQIIHTIPNVQPTLLPTPIPAPMSAPMPTPVVQSTSTPTPSPTYNIRQRANNDLII